MATKIVLVGAGSAQFGYGTLGDIFQSKTLYGSEIVLHDINMAARFCDHIHALKAGRLIAAGDPQSLLNADTLKDIYGIDMDVTEHPVLKTPLAYVV